MASTSAWRVNTPSKRRYISAGGVPALMMAKTSSTARWMAAVALAADNAAQAGMAGRPTASAPVAIRPRNPRRVSIGIWVNDVLFLLELETAVLAVEQPGLRVAVGTVVQNRVHGRAETRPLTGF